MKDASKMPLPLGGGAKKVALPKPSVPDLEGDSLSLEKLGDAKLKTYLPGLKLGDEVWPRLFGCGPAGETRDLEPTPVDVEALEPDGTFLVEVGNELMKELDEGVVFYSYARTLPPKTDPRKLEMSDRLLFYVNKPVPPADLLPPPHMMDSDGLIIDLTRVSGAGQVISTAFQFMSVNDKVVLSWKDEYGSETLTKELKAEDLGKPLLWSIDAAWFQMAGSWCELYYTIHYHDGTQASQSPTQRFTIDNPGSGQSPSLPPPRIPDHDGGMLDPNSYPDGVWVEVDGYVAQFGDELLLTASGKQVVRGVFRIDRAVLDSGRLRFHVPGEWLQANGGEKIALTWQWNRVGGAADSAPLELTLRRPLDLKVPFVLEATAEDSDPGEEVDPAMKQFGFIQAGKLKLGAYVEVPVDSETGGGKITMHWQGYGESGSYSTDKPTAGNNRRFQIPVEFVPPNFYSRVKIFYTVEVDDAQQHSDAYGLRIIKPEPGDYGAISCPDAPDGKLPLSSVKDNLGFYLNSSSWPFFAVGQLVRVFVEGEGKEGGGSLPREYIRENLPVTEEEWFADKVEVLLSMGYLTKLKLNQSFSVHVQVSFDGGVHFEQLLPVDIYLEE